jgi:hypothetical protein
VYATSEPQTQFNKRIAFCLDLHNLAVRAMQFPQDPRASTAAAEEELRERQRQEEDLANNMSVGGGVDANYYFILNRFRASFIGAMTYFFPALLSSASALDVVKKYAIKSNVVKVGR